MSEEQAQPAGEAAPAVPAEAPAAPAPEAPIEETTLGQPDGKADGRVSWRSTVREELRDLAGRFASVNDVLSYADDLRKRNSQMIRRPDANASPEDLAAFRGAIGAGLTPEDYAFPEPPEGQELSDIDKGLRQAVAKVLHKHHVRTTATQDLHDVVMQFAADQAAERERRAVEGRNDSIAQMKREWGADFEANSNVAPRAASQWGGPDFLRWIGETTVDGVKLGDHPMMIRTFARIGRAMGEGKGIGDVGPEERASVSDELDQVTAEMHAARDRGDRITAQRLNDKQYELSRRLYGGAPAVGVGGRTV